MDNNKFWSVTRTSGIGNKGTLVCYDYSTNTFEVKVSFGYAELGYEPSNNWVYAPNGKFYGSTREGGLYKGGTIFEFDPMTNVMTKLWDFRDTLGYEPDGGLFMADNGKLYGSTDDGGIYADGAIFEFDPITRNYRVIQHLLDSVSGRNGVGQLMQASNGKIYGTTDDGDDQYDDGVIFEYDIATDNYRVVVGFDNSSVQGSDPEGGLVEFNQKLYGTTSYGGADGVGTLYEYDPATQNYTVLAHFDEDTTGEGGHCHLTVGPDSILYGSTKYGGDNENGTLYAYDFKTNQLRAIHHFNSSTELARPEGPLTLVNDSLLYGYGRNNGANDEGGIYCYNIVTSTYSVRHNFNSVEGAAPNGSLIVRCAPMDTAVTVIQPSLTANATNVSYQWLNCDSNYAVIPMMTDSVFTATANGNYAVTLKHIHGCVDTSACYSITSIDVERIEANRLFDNVSIYPNPNTGLFYIDLADLEDINIEVYNTLGALISHDNAMNTQVYQLELDGPAGIYIIKLNTKGQTQQYKVIKQ